jgi:hypothetical protein
MKLNCKTGDLAIIIQGVTSNRNVGKLVTVLGPAQQHGYWIVHCDHPMKTILGGLFSSESTVGPIEDYRLRPIRHPGDGAIDESAAWLPPVPLTTQRIEQQTRQSLKTDPEDV